MTPARSALFELLQVAVGTRPRLSRTPSPERWARLRSECDRHALAGVGYVGISKLPPSQCPPLEILAEWIHDAELIKARGKQMSQKCIEVWQRLDEEGFACCILKGQGNLSFYPADLRPYRTSGDIDVWVRDKLRSDDIRRPILYAIGQCEAQGARAHVCYHHTDVMWDGSTELELHYRPSWMSSPWRNVRLQRWFRRHGSSLVMAEVEGGVIPVPTMSFNVVYQLTHIYKHLFEEGIGLRQLVDYGLLLRALRHQQPDEPTARRHAALLMRDIRRLGMGRFAAAVMWVLQATLALPDDCLLCPPNAREGHFLLGEIMQAGNFGKYDPRIAHNVSQARHAWEKLKHNFRLVAHYPEEVLCEPFFRLYHWVWRRTIRWRLMGVKDEGAKGQ